MNAESGQLADWAKTRKMGRSEYVWRFGVGYWGLTMAIFWIALTTWMDGFRLIPIRFFIAFLLFPVAGYVWGMMTWKAGEKIYQKESSLSKDTAAQSNG